MSNLNAKPVLECQKLSKSFIDVKQELNILQSINFSVMAGEQVAIMGQSGSGKTTLLQLLGGLDLPTSGNVLFKGIDFQEMASRQQDVVRNNSIGFIYQHHHLLPEFTALENIAMPLLISNISKKDIMERARELLVKVGLEKRQTHKPGALSGGERQRVALARALATNPDCVLADEPTGNLDPETAAKTFEIMQQLNREYNTTFVIVTHDLDLASQLDKIYSIKDGKIYSKD